MPTLQQGGQCPPYNKDGDDVPLYLEKQLLQLLTELEELREGENL